MKSSPCRSILVILLQSVAMLLSARSQPAAAATPAASKPADDGAAVQWVDVETDKVLFTSREIVRFDWDKQIFELTREKAMDLLSRPGKNKDEFSVRDREGEIYRGCFMSWGSSSGYDGPTIGGEPFGPTKPPLYHIAGGYPGEHGPGAKTRFSPRLQQQLQAAGVLRTINESEQVKPIETLFAGWRERNRDPGVSALLFPETFQLGRDARFYSRFSRARPAALSPAALEQSARSGKNVAGVVPTANEVEVTITPVGSGITWKQSIALDPGMFIKASFGGGNVPLRVHLPATKTGTGENTLVPGPAKVTITVRLKPTAKEPSQTDHQWELPTQQIEILPAAPSSQPKAADSGRSKDGNGK